MDKRDLRDPEKLGEYILLMRKHCPFPNATARDAYKEFGEHLDVPDVVDVGPLDRYPR